MRRAKLAMPRRHASEDSWPAMAVACAFAAAGWLTLFALLPGCERTPRDCNPGDVAVCHATNAMRCYDWRCVPFADRAVEVAR